MSLIISPMKKIRLAKALAQAGIASRRACESLIFSGQVKVNGEKVLKPQTLVATCQDQVQVDDKTIDLSIESKIYFILNKPKGYVCSNSRKYPKIVLDLFPQVQQRLFTVGRLDKNTTGLLIITNDGFFAQKTIHPSAGIEKEYLVKTDQEINPTHLNKMKEGIQIGRSSIKPKKVQKVRRGTLKVTVMEGKKHEVRLLVKKAGLKTKELKRIRIGNLHLGSLNMGQHKKMSLQQIESIFPKSS